MKVKGKFNYKMKFIFQSTKEVELEVSGKDMDIDAAKKLGQEKAEVMANKLGNNFRVVACIEIVGSKDK